MSCQCGGITLNVNTCSCFLARKWIMYTIYFITHAHGLIMYCFPVGLSHFYIFTWWIYIYLHEFFKVAITRIRILAVKRISFSTMTSSHGTVSIITAWQHQAITNVDFPLMRLCVMNTRAYSQRMPKILFSLRSSKIILLTFRPYSQGLKEANETRVFPETGSCRM